MKNPLLLVTLLAALGAAPAFGQSETAAPAEDGTTAETGTDGTPIGGALDLGESAEQPQAPQGPRTYVKETFTDWALQCIEVQDADDVCQMYQLLTDGSGASVAEVSIFKLANGGQAVAGGTFVVPLETLLTQKLTVAVDGGSAKRYDFSFCAPIGCYARVGFTADDIQRFRAGAVANITIVPALAPDQKVTVPMSLSGFTAAFDAVSAVSQ